MTEKNNVMEKRELKATPDIIRANIQRLFGTFRGAAEKTGIARQTFHNAVSAGEVPDPLAGQLYKRGIDPAELVRPIEEKRA